MTGLRFPLMNMRRPLRLAALAGFAAMLFTQAALVLAACGLDGGMPSRGHAMASAVGQPADTCHEEAPANHALCAAHYLTGEQTLDKFQAKVPVLPIEFLPAGTAWVAPHPAVWLPPEPAPAASPPARILFQSLLI